MSSRTGPVHVATIHRKVGEKVYTSHLLRRTYREGGKVKHQTLGNISHLPGDLIEVIRRRLAGDTPSGQWDVVRNLPHGHVAAVLGLLRDIGLETTLASRDCQERLLVVAMIVARIISPQSKLATARDLDSQDSATTSLAWELGLERINEHHLYAALDWLQQRQTRIENKLAKKHLQDGTLLLYDVSSSYYTGQESSLVQFGYNRDGKKRFPQIVYGLLCNAQGCPIAIEVFAGNTADPNTLESQVNKVIKRFGVKRTALVGDRGMITTKRINETLREVDGLDWISALRADNIKKLAEQQILQTSLFDQRNPAEISSPDFPGERLIVCRNPLLAAERARKRGELLRGTEEKLDEVVEATRRERNPLRGEAAIGVRIGKVINKYKVGKHFQLEVGEECFSYRRDEAKIAAESALDGFYVIRTSVAKEELGAEEAVRAYKSLSQVERGFRCLKTVGLNVRPIHHRKKERIKGHVFLCMLAYYVEWHMRQRLAPVLFDDQDKKEANAGSSPVQPAQRSQSARRKDGGKRTPEGYSVQSFRSLLAYLGTLCKNRLRLRDHPDVESETITLPTPYQKHIFKLLGLPIPG